MLIINDLHVGTKRQAGTTPASQVALREYIYAEFERLLNLATHDHIVILGDLFDGFTVETADVIRTYNLLMHALNRGNRLTLIMGNHDSSAKGDRVSSFHLLAHFMCSSSDKVSAIDHIGGFSRVGPVGNKGWVYAIPHCMNQDLFNLEIERAIGNDGHGDYLLLHCNIKNEWAAEADHSLDINDAQLGALMRAGWTLVVGHEHHHRTMRGGRVVIPGNQIATSVADLLTCESKFYTTITDKVETHEWAKVSDIYAEVDWTDIDDAPEKAFIRVTGTATAEQAADVVAAVAKLRQRSDSYVVSNACKVEGLADFESLSQASFEDVSKVDVLELLLEEFTAEEAEVIKRLLK